MEKITKHSNTVLKIVSFILAIVLWAYVAYMDNPDISHWVRDVPITVVGSEALSEAGFYVTGTNRTSIDVKLRGDRTALSKIELSDISVVLDVSDISREGDTAIICDISVNSSRVEVVSSKNATVTVSAEEIITDTYPISVRIVGSPADGYSVFDPSLSNSEVNVRGAKSVISTIASVSTKSVSVNDANLGGTVSVGLTAYDAEGNSVSGVTFEPSTVDVSYTVLREKTVPLKVALTKIPIDKDITYSPDTIKIYGLADALATIDSIDSMPLDVSEAKDGDIYNVRLYVPYGARLINDDSTVDITVSVEDLNAEDE